MSADAARRRVSVVTGGGGGIGAAIAMALGARGDIVVTVDPLLSLDGASALPEPEQTTADRIVAAGGTARASTASVTDPEALRSLLDSLVHEFGGLDVVVNAAGITRATSFASGDDADWRAVLDVHLEGYRNVLCAALPHMSDAGSGHILGVTSGSGWRRADAGAYGMAKRAVAALTWELGRHAPPGVVINAISPIAVTRMVTAALDRTRSAGTAAPSTGGLSLGALPAPEAIGPLGAHLVAPAFAACRGSVLFTAGSEVAVIEPPRLLEVLRSDDADERLLAAFQESGLVPAEREQASGGGSNARFATLPDEVVDPHAEGTRVVVVADRSQVAGPILDELTRRGLDCAVLDAATVPADTAAASSALAEVADHLGAVIVALGGPDPSSASTSWDRILDEHGALAEHLARDAAWVRAVAEHAGTGRPIRLLLVADTRTAGGRSRAQALAQLARASVRSTGGQVSMLAVGVDASDPAPVGSVLAHLARAADPELAGAELAVGAGWFGMRSHPRVAGSVTLHGTEVPDWFDSVVAELVGGAVAT